MKPSAPLSERGFLHDCTDADGLDELLQAGPITAYIGFDLTADCLHVGSLLQLMVMRWLQHHGHRPIILFGGATTLIGDPSFRDEGRPLLDARQIGENGNAIAAIVRRLAIDAPIEPPRFVDNLDWAQGLGYLSVLRSVGPHFTVNRMLAQDSVKQRLEREQGLTFLEFNYMVLQAIDFVQLHKAAGCRLQIGGSDQWGNITCGVDLARRQDGTKLFGLTTPLVTLTNGTKMGKTARGAIWLDETKLDVFNFWQFWRDVPDEDVLRFLRLFTELPMAKIAKFEQLHGQDLNEAKILLATEVTTIVHGREHATKAASTAQSVRNRTILESNLPTIECPVRLSPSGTRQIDLLDALVRGELARSRTAARTLIQQGGCRIEGTITTTTNFELPHTRDAAFFLLTAGRKRHILVRPI